MMCAGWIRFRASLMATRRIPFAVLGNPLLMSSTVAVGIRDNFIRHQRHGIFRIALRYDGAIDGGTVKKLSAMVRSPRG
jgi:hypothetical protein